MTDRSTLTAGETFSPVAFAQRYVQRVQNLLKNLDINAVAAVIDVFVHARQRGNTIFFVGNGGSAATAEHFANDLTVGAASGGGPLFRAVSLASNMALLTCIANDFGYDCVFERQLSNLMKAGDVVVGISASGNSPNVVKALEYAANNAGIPIAIVGFDGGRMKNIAKHVIHLASPKGDYGPVEDVQLVLDHLITQCLAELDRKTRAPESEPCDPAA